MADHAHSVVRLDQYRAEVVDVGQGGSGDHEIAEPLEKSVGVIVAKTSLRVDAERAGAMQRVGRDERSGIIFRAVDAVGIGGDGIAAGTGPERDGEAQKIFGIAAAAAFAAERSPSSRRRRG